MFCFSYTLALAKIFLVNSFFNGPSFLLIVQLLAEIQAKKDDEIFFNEITKGNETTELYENLKIVFFNKNIVKNNLLPELKSEDNPLDFQRIDNLEKEDF